MDHVFKHRCNKENCSRNGRQRKRTIEAFEANGGPQFDSNLQEIGTNEICRILQAPFTAAMYAEKDLCVRQLYYTLFRVGRSSVTLSNNGPFMQTDFYSARQGASGMLNTTAPTFFHIHFFFNSIAIVEEAISAKALKYSR